MKKSSVRLVALFACTGLAACETAKSANPLSPSVAGPIPGVVITEPKLLEPAPNQELNNSTAQPVQLLIENAGSNGVRPLSYRVEVASDAGFSNILFSRGNITPGDGGRTLVQMGDKLPSDRVYFWRVRAEDGANTGPYSEPRAFVIFTPVEIGVPALISPAGGSTLDSPSPTFRIGSPPRSGPAGDLVYQLAVGNNTSFVPELALYQVSEEGSETTFDAPLELPYDLTFYWRVRAFDSGPSGASGPWSAPQSFRTPSPPPPPSVPAPTPGPGPGPWNGGSCALGNGPAIVACIQAKFAGHTAAGVSGGQRRANTEYLRDRIIEAGLCSGMDLGRNRKRGGPEISVDFLVDRTSGGSVGIDIAAAYEDTSLTLRLHWVTSTHPFYQAYPLGSCNGV